MTLQPCLKVSDIVLSPVIRIAPLKIGFCDEHPAIVEMMKTVEFKVPNKKRSILPLFSDSSRSSAPDWKELLSSNQCEVSNDRTIFKTTHTGLFTVVARLPSAYNSVTVKPEDVNTAELTVSELPGFKVEIPPTSVNLSTEIGATIHFDEGELDLKGQVLAPVSVELEPQNLQLNHPVPLTIPIPEYAEIKEKYPEAEVQVWHTPNREEPKKWKFFEDSDVHVSQSDRGNHEATFHTSKLTKYRYAWNNIEWNDEVDRIVTQSISNVVVEAELKTISGRCQVFMSSEQNVGSHISFSIAALVYPFQEPYQGLLNYSYSLFDSGHIPVEFEIGILHYTLKFEDHLFPNNEIDSTSAFLTRVLSKSVKLSLHHVARADFPVKLIVSAKLANGMRIAQLLIDQGLGNLSQHEYHLIMVSFCMCVHSTHHDI